MVSIRRSCLCALILLMHPGYSAHAAAPLEPPDLATIEESERTQILILATPHLRELGSDLNSQALHPVIARLQRFAPDAVAVEALSPSVIRSMEAQGEKYTLVLERFAGAALKWGKRARETLNLPSKDLEAETSKILAVAESRRAYDHRALALRLLALNDVPSAVLQWAYVKAENRKGGDDIPADIAEFLTQKLSIPNETYALAVPLAKRLSHVRLTSIDDHSEKDVFLAITNKLQAEMKTHPLWEGIISAPLYQEAKDVLANSNRAGDLTPAYRFYNSPAYGRRDIRTQWDFFLKTRLESGLDRMRLALWETRNFLIAAHIRRLTAEHSGERLLVIIGASHKAFLDAYLAQAMDVRIVPAESVLGGSP